MDAFDSSFLTFLFVPNSPCRIDRPRERVENLIGEIHGRGDRIIVPTPALTELLIGVGHSKSQILREMTHNPKFLLAPFDVRAALELALMAEKLPKQKHSKAEDTTKAKINFDRQIVAIAKVAGASMIYSEDDHIHKIAGACGLKSRCLSDVALPHRPYKGETLFDMEKGNVEKSKKENE